MAGKNSDGGLHEPLATVRLHEPPDSLVALREELLHHPDICEYAKDATSFEDVLGKIALKLDIILDGLYDVADICAMLTTALKGRYSNTSTPHLRAFGLQDVELVEREGSVSIEKRNREEIIAAPEGSIRIESLTSQKPSGIKDA